MKVLLITPENRFIRAFRKRQHNNFVQLTMPYLAGFVRAPYQVALIDEYNQTVDYDTDADLVGITCSTPNATHVYRMSDEFRRRGRRVVLGGPHVTLLPEEAAPHADSLAVGVSPAQSLFLNWGYHRAVTSRLPGHPIPA